MMNMKKLNINFLYCLVISFVFMLIGTKSSPLYVINDWVDSNCFFTVGKGMMNGLVPYLDLFEQKGPLLYFIHGIAYLISNKSFFGVYILESISFAIFLYFVYKTIRLYLNDKQAICLLPILSAIILTTEAFKMGDSAEEFVFPFLAYSLYTFMCCIKMNSKLSRRDFIVNGICAGCVLWIKYSMIGFWFAWMMFIFVDYILNRRYKESIKICLYYLFGMLLATIPWLIYFGIHGALDVLFDVYFGINLSAYSTSMPILMKLKSCFEIFVRATRRNVFAGFLIFLGAITLLCDDDIKRRNKVFSIIAFSFLILTVYIGGFAFKYYYLIFTPFCIFGVIGLFKVFYQLFDINFDKWKDILCLFITVFSFWYLVINGKNVDDIRLTKDDYAQYVFLDYINEVSNATILNYGFLDGGFYLTTGSLPNNRYFMRLNLKYENYPAMMDSQNDSIRKKKTDFVILRTRYMIDSNRLRVPHLYENYKLVIEFTQFSEKRKMKYMLFRAK